MAGARAHRAYGHGKRGLNFITETKAVEGFKAGRVI